MNAFLRVLLASLAAMLITSCSSFGYLVHVGSGQARLLASRCPMQAMIDDPAIDPVLRRRLAGALAARAFASERLALPRNRSYTRYADLHRDYSTWTVFAAPALSTQPLTHCFPIAGCVAYLGYFSEARAQAEADRLRKLGNDVHVAGSAAYSTLGWFADPVVSPMLRWSDDELDGIVFHELAHQRVYVKDDTAFNESYASFVQRQGLVEWHRERGLAAPDDSDDAIDRAFSCEVLALRAELDALYRSEASDEAKLAGKSARFATFRKRYHLAQDHRPTADHRYDRWVDGPLNNASLLPFGLYDQWVPAFAALFESVDSDWPRFHQAVAGLARAKPPERQAALERLQQGQSAQCSPSA